MRRSMAAAVAVGLVSICAMVCRGAVLRAANDAPIAGSAGGVQQPAQPAQSAPPTQSTPSAPTQPARSGGDISSPKLIKDVKPAYPTEATRAHVQGVVTLEVTVGADGNVQDARVLTGVPLLNQAAIDAVKQWKFTPAMANGVPVPARVTAEVSFEQLGRHAPAPEGGTGSATDAAIRNGAGIGTGVGAPLLSDEMARRDPFLLALNRAGVFQVGMDIDTVYRRIPRTQTKLVDRQANNHFTPAIEIRLDPNAPQPALFAIYRDLGGEWRVWTLDVIDPRFRTVDGLGVGSTFAQIRASSPGAPPLFNEHGPFVLLLDRGLSFWFDASAVVGHTVPDTAVVTRVSIGGGPLPSSPRSAH